MQDTEAAGREFLTFMLAGEEYAIDILKVQEIRGYERPTPMANAPSFLKGVINLRGNIVPIIDLRIKFNLSSVEYNDQTVVIVLNIASRTIGVVVDAVSDVTNLSPEQIKPAPELGSVFDVQYLMGLGAVEDSMLILLDIEKLMTSQEMGLIDEHASIR